MQVKKVIVDEIPKCCNDCELNVTIDDGVHYCPCINERIPYEMYNFRAHLCPLNLDKTMSKDLYFIESWNVGDGTPRTIFYQGDAEITKEEYEGLMKEREE